jgi:hypothetical protein
MILRKARLCVARGVCLTFVVIVLPAKGVEIPFTEHVISTTADGATSVFATDVDGDGDVDVLSTARQFAPRTQRSCKTRVGSTSGGICPGGLLTSSEIG